MRKALYILSQLNDIDVEWMANAGNRRSLTAGEVIITAGKQVESLFIILDGKISVGVKGIGEIAKLNAGEILGEISFVDSTPPYATVMALIESNVLELPRATIEKRLETEAGFAGRFYKALAIFLADRLRSTVGHLGDGHEEGGDAETPMVVELDDNLLDNVSLAGDRFDRLLRQLQGE
jgi:CRP-like cAMP-binding protein